MGFFSSGRDKFTPSVPERIDVREDNIKKRTAAAVLLAAVGIFALVWAVNGLLSRPAGWTEIEADTADQASCAGEFQFYYNAGADGGSPTEQIKALTGLYTEAAVAAEKRFSASVADESVHGIGWLNAHINQRVTLDKAVTDALALLAQYGSREPFLAPVYEQYTTLCFCATDEEAADIDPFRNEEQRLLLAEMAAFANDPAHIAVILEDGNHATLRVSEEYLNYAQKNGIESFVDLYWMKNAFAVDYMAERLASEGFTDGYLTCGDGFTRSLGGDDISLSATVYDREGRNIYKAASLSMGKVKSAVMFHDIPLSQQNDSMYYQYADGRMVTPYISLSDGLCRASVSNLTVCSPTLGCAESMLAARSAYMAEELPVDALRQQMGENGAFAFTRGRTVTLSSGEIKAESLLNDGEVVYTAETLA